MCHVSLHKYTKFIHFAVDEHLGCLQILLSTKKLLVNMNKYMYPVGYVSRRGIAISKLEIGINTNLFS